MAGRGKPGGGRKGGSKGAGKGGTTPTARMMHTKVKTARGRTNSSTRWLQRQLNDPYVAQARADGYRSRAAYKIIELDDRFNFLRPGKRIVDLGAAPGAWSQVAAARTGSTETGSEAMVIGVDILEMEQMAGVELMQLDMREPDAPDIIRAAANGPVDVVISDLAPSTTGHGPTDHIRIVALVEIGLDFALSVLEPGGIFVAKVFKGGTEGELLELLKTNFKTVKHAKPASSRPESAETYVVALDFKGNKDDQ
jgi:23S rRNA (uridine2552-2'-O)-methyltransferase